VGGSIIKVCPSKLLESFKSKIFESNTESVTNSVQGKQKKMHIFDNAVTDITLQICSDFCQLFLRLHLAQLQINNNFIN